MNQSEVMRRPFNIETHKKAFKNYLEVLIAEDGTITYAVPSHQLALIRAACIKLNVTTDQLSEMCPQEYYCDFNNWLCKVSGCVEIRTQSMGGYPNARQREVIEELISHGLYLGRINEKKARPNFIMKELLGL